MMLDLLEKKRENGRLTKAEIARMVEGYVAGEIPDYQMSAMLMAICCNGMDAQETVDLTMAMVASGDTIDLSKIDGVKIDKHSTGGVGDTTTLVIAPLVAAAGVPVAKMSGRGLGFTGGTIDKLDSIEGFSTALSINDMTEQIKRIGIAIAQQTDTLVPADKLLYALRDVTGTVRSIPLIASSIMSKKIASGADKILLDVKVGSGAFMKTVEEAKQLAEAMVAIGEMLGRETRAVLSSMEEPLGKQIGNALEVADAVEVLRGKREGHLKDVCYALAGNMLHMAGITSSVRGAYPVLDSLIRSGKAMDKFRELILAQGGNDRFIDDLSLLPQADYQMEVLCEKEGYIRAMDTDRIGMCASLLGAGRQKKGDPIDLASGIVMHGGIGDWKRRGDILAMLYTNQKEVLVEASKRLREAVTMTEHSVKKPRLIYGIVDKNGFQAE